MVLRKLNLVVIHNSAIYCYDIVVTVLVVLVITIFDSQQPFLGIHIHWKPIGLNLNKGFTKGFGKIIRDVCLKQAMIDIKLSVAQLENQYFAENFCKTIKKTKKSTIPVFNYGLVYSYVNFSLDQELY